MELDEPASPQPTGALEEPARRATSASSSASGPSRSPTTWSVSDRTPWQAARAYSSAATSPTPRRPLRGVALAVVRRVLRVRHRLRAGRRRVPGGPIAMEPGRWTSLERTGRCRARRQRRALDVARALRDGVKARAQPRARWARGPVAPQKRHRKGRPRQSAFTLGRQRCLRFASCSSASSSRRLSRAPASKIQDRGPADVVAESSRRRERAAWCARFLSARTAHRDARHVAQPHPNLGRGAPTRASVGAAQSGASANRSMPAGRHRPRSVPAVGRCGSRCP
jgi:hypothetical protein